MIHRWHGASWSHRRVVPRHLMDSRARPSCTSGLGLRAAGSESAARSMGRVVTVHATRYTKLQQATPTSALTGTGSPNGGTQAGARGTTTNSDGLGPVDFTIHEHVHD